ncbi:MAG TPA: hypothetical protein PKM34_05485 [Bacteroidales bacterium]|nr:hypothetical protein [Bacteroidales bacterium]
MKIILATWITLFLIPVIVHSQVNVTNSVEVDYNYQQYKSVFDEEQGAFGEPAPDPGTPPPILFNTVPGWLQEPMPASAASFQVIGISDPGLDSVTARRQAIFRALYLGSLMNGCRVRNLVDYYSQEKSAHNSELTGKYADYFEFTSFSPHGVDESTVVHQHLNDNGECLVIIDFPAYSGGNPALAFQTNGMITEFQRNGKYESNSRIDFSLKAGRHDDADGFRYLFRSINGLVDMESYSGNEMLPQADARYKYTQTVTTEAPRDKQGIKTDRGLWNALLLAIIKDITVDIRTRSALVKSTADNYTGNSLALDREAVTGKLSFRLNRIILYDINLWAILEQINFTQP